MIFYGFNTVRKLFRRDSKIVFKTKLDTNYDLFRDADRRNLMFLKIQKNLPKFKGNLRFFYESLCAQTLVYRQKADVMVQAWWINEEQRRFVEKVLNGEIKMPDEILYDPITKTATDVQVGEKKPNE